MQYHAELAKASTFYIWSLIILTFASVSAQLSTWSIKKTSLDFSNFQFEINHITRANETVVQLKVFTKASTSKFIDAIVTRYNWQFDTFQNNLQSGIIILMSTSLIAFIRHSFSQYLIPSIRAKLIFAPSASEARYAIENITLLR